MLYKFSYDPKGRQIAVDNTGTPGVPSLLLNYTYDDQDNLLSVSDTINGVAKGNTAYTYDTLNRISRITQSGNGVASKRVDFGYDDIGQIKSVNRYSDLSGNQLVRGTTYTYDAKNRLDVLSHGSGISHDLDYDNGNRITKITDKDGFTNYTHDKNNQLTVADHSNSNKPDEGFSYDANGNRNSSGYHTKSGLVTPVMMAVERPGRSIAIYVFMASGRSKGLRAIEGSAGDRAINFS